MPQINSAEWGVNNLYLGENGVDSNHWPKLSFSAADKAELEGSLHIAGTLTGTLGDSMVGTEQLKAELTAKLVTNGDNHDHSGGDGAPIKHSSLQLDGGRNPHGTTAADIQAFPIAGGRISGDLQVSGSSVFSGRVGIGTTNPAEQLDVKGRIKSDLLTLGLWPATRPQDPKYVFFGVNTLEQTSEGNYALIQAATGEGGEKPGNTYLNSPVQINFSIANEQRMILDNEGNVGIGTTTPNAKLEVAGSIRSPMWNLTQVFNMKEGPLPISGTFNSGGGILVIFVSGVGFSNFGNQVIGMDILVDDLKKGEAKRFTNEKLVHRVFVSNPLIVTGLAKGGRRLSFVAQGDTQTNAGDFFSATVLELPW